MGYLDIRLGTAVLSAEVGGMLAAVAAGLVNPSYREDLINVSSSLQVISHLNTTSEISSVLLF